MLDKEIGNNISNTNLNKSTINQFKDCNFYIGLEEGKIYNEFIKDVLKKTKSEIDLGNFEEVNNVLTKYMTTEGFDKLIKEQKIEIIYYRAICLLNLGKYTEAELVAEQILRIENNSIRYYEFKASLYILIQDRKLYIKAINKLKELNETNEKLNKYNIKMLYTEERYNEIVSKYIIKDCISSELPQTNECIGMLISSLLVEKNYDLANIVLESIETESEYIIYLKAIVNISNIVKKNVLQINIEDKIILKETIKLLKSIRKYFDENRIYQKGYYFYLLNTMVIENAEDCIEEYERLNNDLKQDKELKIIYIDALFFNNKLDSAEKNIREILDYANDVMLLPRLIDILDVKHDYKEIIKLLENKNLLEIDENGFLASRYVNALIYEKGFESIEKTVEDRYLNLPLVSIEISEYLYINNYNKEIVKKYCDKATQSVNEKTNKVVIDYIAEKCEVMQLFNRGIELLEKYGMLYNKTKKTYIRSVINAEKSFDSSKSNALKIIDEMIISENNFQLFIYKGILLTKINRKSEAFGCFEKAFKMESNYMTAYYCLSSEMERQNYVGLEKYISILDESEKLEHMLIVASAYAKLSIFDESNKKIYKMVYKHKNDIDMDILATVVFNIYFSDYSKYNWKRVDRVENDVIVVLEDKEKNIRKICIDTDIISKDIVNEFYDVELYKCETIVRNKLALKKKDDFVNLEGKKYFIKAILNKYEYVFNKTRDLFFQKLPNKSKYAEVIKVDSQNPLERIMPILRDRREYANQIINSYRMKDNDIGLTISGVSKKLGSSEYDVISALLNDKTGIYYVGEITNELKEEYIITLSALIVSKIFGIDEIFVEIKDKIHIAESTIVKLNKYFLTKEKDNSSAVLGVGKDDKPYMLENTEKNIMREIEFITELIELANNFKIEKNNYQENIIELFSVLDEEEQDVISIAKNNKYTLIADDLCLRKVYKWFCGSNDHGNSIEFIRYFTFNKRVDLLEKISDTQYLYCINKDIVLELLNWSKDKKKLVNIITNLLGTKEKYNHNRRIIGEAILEFSKDDIRGTKKQNLLNVLGNILKIDEKYK